MTLKADTNINLTAELFVHWLSWYKQWGMLALRDQERTGDIQWYDAVDMYQAFLAGRTSVMTETTQACEQPSS